MMLSTAATHPPIDFLTIGHICYDLVAGGRVVGGAAAYTGMTAQALGCRPAIVTSAAPADDWAAELPGIPIHVAGASATTVFENIYLPTGRIQTVHSVAGRLEAEDVPLTWAQTPLVFLGPIANEIDPNIIHLFGNSVVGVGPQGWMRRWDDRGRVYAVDWQDAGDVLPMASVTFISREDLSNPALIDAYAQQANCLVVTDGSRGCRVYFRGEERSFPAPEVTAIDTTGAGDIFAAAYLVRLHQTEGDHWEAAEFANQVASCSVTCVGLEAKAKVIRRLMAEVFYQGHAEAREIH